MITLTIDMIRVEYTSGQVAFTHAAAVVRRTEGRYKATVDFSAPVPLLQVDCSIIVATSVCKVIKVNILSVKERDIFTLRLHSNVRSTFLG